MAKCDKKESRNGQIAKFGHFRICPARVKKLMISTNISGEKLKACGYPFKYTVEDALADWFKDNENRCLE